MKFQSAPRVLARGDDIFTAMHHACHLFQSAPRVLARGDCGWSFNFSRKCLLAAFRQPVNFSDGQSVCFVKEQEKTSVATG